MPEHEVTMGELVRRLDDISRKLDTFDTKHENTYLRKDAMDAFERINNTQRTDLEERLERLENRSEWIVRTVGALIIAALLGLVLVSNRPAQSSSSSAISPSLTTYTITEEL